jgi:CBS domain-containing protein
MKVSEIMTKNPAVCEPETPLQEVAQLMLKNDCGEIPVVDSRRTMRPVGVVTDRDIVVRCVAEGKNPLEGDAGDVMSSPVVTVTPDTDIDDVGDRMEENQVRRIPVVDEAGAICGIVAQADIARHAHPREVAEVVREVSR